jgi:group I intron endonuclease
MTTLRVCGIYCISNATTGDCYIGQATDIYERWHVHKSKLKSGQHNNQHLLNAWMKHGAGAFTVAVLEVMPKGCTKEDITAAEQKWIDAIHPAYNKAMAGTPHAFRQTNAAQSFTDAPGDKLGLTLD